MTAAMLGGLASGVVHAVTGPDHVLSLLPLSLGRSRAWRIGAFWGLGHGLGTLLIAALLTGSIALLGLGAFESWAETLAGLGLMAMGFWALSRKHGAVEASCQERRGAFFVGLVHGVTGAAALLLLLPAALTADAWGRALYLGAFVVGSTVAMALFCGVLAALSRLRSVSASTVLRISRGASVCAIALGGAFVLVSL